MHSIWNTRHRIGTLDPYGNLQNYNLLQMIPWALKNKLVNCNRKGFIIESYWSFSSTTGLLAAVILYLDPNPCFRYSHIPASGTDYLVVRIGPS